MKKYDNYKDSGIEWIGEIPSHWELSKSKFEINVINGFAFKSEDFEDEGTPVIRIGDLKPPYVDLSNAKCIDTSKYKDLKPYSIIHGDLLLAMTGATIGKTATYVNDEISYLNQRVGLIKPLKNNNAGFTKYIYDSYFFREFVNLECSGSAQENIGKSQLGELKIAVPNSDEQTAIANYLDQKTTQIDDLIFKKEQFIQLLEEERVAVINQAVTKGLDPTVPMKDSGIDGLGLIPLNWKLMKFKMFAPILTCGVASTPEYVDESVGVPFLSAQNVKNNRMRLDNYKHISTDLHNSLTKNRKPQNGDILVTRVGAGIGDACIVDCNFEFSVYVSLTHIRVDESIVKNKFIMYFFSTDYCKYLNSQGTVTGGGVGNLNVNNVERYKVPIPPLEEQELIVDFITSKSTEIDKIVFKTQQEIELLKEYKTALISEVVTGKVDVREYSKN